MKCFLSRKQFKCGSQLYHTTTSLKEKKPADATNGIFSYKLYNYYCPNMQAYKEMEIPTYIKLEM